MHIKLTDPNKISKKKMQFCQHQEIWTFHFHIVFHSTNLSRSDKVEKNRPAQLLHHRVTLTINEKRRNSAIHQTIRNLHITNWNIILFSNPQILKFFPLHLSLSHLLLHSPPVPAPVPPCSAIHSISTDIPISPTSTKQLHIPIPSNPLYTSAWLVTWLWILLISVFLPLCVSRTPQSLSLFTPVFRLWP